MKVQVHGRWLLILASTVIVFLLRHHKLWLTIYVVLAAIAFVLVWVWLPRKVADAERRFTRESLRHLATRDVAGLQKLVAEQWLLRRYGRRHILPDALALAASAAGDHEAARRFYAEALQHAPIEDRPRIEINLAGEELATGRLGEAEGRYRTILRRRPDMPLALANLGRVLLRRGEDAAEAAELLRRAIEVADPRDAPGLQVDRAEALVKAHDARWTEALAQARENGADPEALARVEALAG